MAVTYLIDYENTHENGFIGVEDICDCDRVYCIFTRNAAKISLQTLTKIKCGAIRFVESPAGKQSLDAVLCSYLGYLLAQNHEEHMAYVIVSNDNIYEKVASFWNLAYGRKVVKVRAAIRQGANIQPNKQGNKASKPLQQPEPITTPVTQEPVVPPEKTPIVPTIEEADKEPPYMKEARTFVASNQDKKNLKQLLYRKMVSLYGQKKGTENYNTAKTVLFAPNVKGE